MSTENRISDAELEVMKLLWREEPPVPIRRITAALQEEKGWDRSTVRTLLRRLSEKGAVSQEKRDIFYYTPLVSEEEISAEQTQELIDRMYGGSAGRLVASLVESRNLTREDLEELFDCLDRAAEQGGKK